MLTKQQIVEEYSKCFHDKSRVYMIENYMSTYDATVKSTVPFKLFPKQKELLLALGKYSNNLATKPRQSGISTVSAAWLACEMALADNLQPETVLIVANRLDLSKLDLKKIKEFLLQLPRWFWGNDYYGSEEKEKKTIFVKDNDKYFELFNGSKSHAVSSQDGSARGISSVSFLVFDEAAFIENGISVFSQAIACTATGGKCLLISTPQGRDQLYYGIYSKSKSGENDFHITELRWYQDPRYNKNLSWNRLDKTTGNIETIHETTIDKTGSVAHDEEHWVDMVRDGYTPSSPWYVGMCNKFNHDNMKIAQELDVSFLGSSGTVIDTEIIEFHNKTNTREPIYVDNFFKEAWIYKEPIEGHKYIMCVDVSTGSGEDSSVIHILDVDHIDDNGQHKIEQVFEYQGKIQGDILGELTDKYGRYYGNALVVVDCQGQSGEACVLKLQSLGYPNLYYDDPNLKNVTVESDNNKYNDQLNKKIPGFRASGSRLQQIMNLEKMLRFNEILPRSTRFTQELTTFIWKNGRPDHQSGYHDDTIMSMAMGLYVLQFSFKKLEAVKEKNRVILNTMILVQNMLNNGTSSNIEQRQTNIPLPFYTNNTVNKIMTNKKVGNDPNKMLAAMAFGMIGF